MFTCLLAAVSLSCRLRSDLGQICATVSSSVHVSSAGASPAPLCRCLGTVSRTLSSARPGGGTVKNCVTLCGPAAALERRSRKEGSSVPARPPRPPRSGPRTAGRASVSGEQRELRKLRQLISLAFRGVSRVTGTPQTQRRHRAQCSQRTCAYPTPRPAKVKESCVKSVSASLCGSSRR